MEKVKDKYLNLIKHLDVLIKHKTWVNEDGLNVIKSKPAGKSRMWNILQISNKSSFQQVKLNKKKNTEEKKGDMQHVDLFGDYVNKPTVKTRRFRQAGKQLETSH